MKARVRFLDTRPLRANRAFRELWIGTSASQLGAQLATVAVLAQVWELTGSPVGTGAIAFGPSADRPGRWPCAAPTMALES